MYVVYLIFLTIVILINSILIVVLYRHGQKNTTIASLIVLLLQVNIWFFPKFLTNALHAHGILFESLSRISALGYIFVPVTFLFFTISYGMYHKLFQKISFWVLLLMPPLTFLYLSWTSDLVGVHSAHLATLYSWGYETPTGRLWSLYMIWYDLVMLIAISVLIYNYRSLVDHLRKQQTLAIILAVTIPLIAATITTGILPVLNVFIFPIGLMLACLMVILGVSAIYRYGWFVVTPMTILSSINHVIITVDHNGNVLQMNPYSEKILHVRLPQTIGKPLGKFLVVKDKRKKHTNVLKLLDPVLTAGKSIVFDTYSILNKSQKLFATNGSITPIFSEKKGVVGANIFLSDGSREKEREKQKSDYFSMLSHELKTPITSVKAYSQLLLNKMQKEETSNKDLVIKINHQLDSLTRLINDFLELSRLTSGKFRLERSLFNIDDFVNEVVETMRLTHKRRTLSVHGQTNSIVFADRDRIEQILINFLTNAIKFSPENTEIDIHLSADSAHITVGVQDYGKGIHPKFHKRIFDRFFQVEEKGGLGIGLFIASTIVKAHNGKIWVESEAGKGSTFYFSLPLQM